MRQVNSLIKQLFNSGRRIMRTSFLFPFIFGFLLLCVGSSSSLAFSIVSVVQIFYFLFNFSTNGSRKDAAEISLPPGPNQSWPLVGCIPEMLRNKPVFRWIHNLMEETNSEIVCIKLANVHVIAVKSPELSREFLRKQDSNFASRPKTVAMDIGSRGYLTTVMTTGDQWKKMRRVLTSELTSLERLRWLHQKRIDEADYLVRIVYKSSLCNGGVVDVREITREYLGNVIRKLIFGRRSFNTKDDISGKHEKEHIDALAKVHVYLFAFSVSDYVPWLSCLDLEGDGKILRKCMAIIDKYHDPIINERIKKKRSGLETHQDDLLDVLIMLKDENGKPLLSSEEIKGQVTELMLAAVDNPPVTVEGALAELINHPDLFKRAVEEIDRVVGKDRLVQESDFSQLNFIKACTKEAFRLYPVAAFNVPHMAKSDSIVEGYFIPKGSHILISRMGLGRNARIWKDPLKFNPDRHLKDGISDISLQDPDLNMLVFGMGRRGCAGVNLGTSITIMMLARLIQAFSWSPPPGMDHVDTSESDDSTHLAHPLLALPKPRISKSMIEGCCTNVN